MASDSFPAFVAAKTDDGFIRGVTELSTSDLPGDGVLVDVEWSSVNYKDALASTPDGRVARISPLVPGIDLAGRVAEDGGGFAAGTAVLAHGYDIGVSRHGGFAARARVPAEWMVELPVGLDTREAMVIGTAGYTAALSVVALLDHGVAPEAVNILAGLGFEVVASTGKAESHEFLRSLGAVDVVDRSGLGDSLGRPLDSTAWAAAVDCVGGVTLANVLARIHYGGAVAASGLTGGAQVPTTVMPFILRGVSLLGIDSVQTPIERRREVWSRLAGDLKPGGLDTIGHSIGLDRLDEVLGTILPGGVTGRYVVDPTR
jgi:acrylyl-CoA reductase (NADPH)